VISAESVPLNVEKPRAWPTSGDFQARDLPSAVRRARELRLLAACPRV